MTPEEGLDVSRKSFRYLLNGYFLVVVAVFLYALDFAGSFSTGGFGPLVTGVALFINPLGFLVIVYSHVWYLKKRGYLSVLDKKVFGIPVKYFVISVAVTVIILGIASVALFDSYDLGRMEGENYYLSIVVTIPMLVTFGIIYFNILFLLAGPLYMVLFRYVVKQSDSKPS